MELERLRSLMQWLMAKIDCLVDAQLNAILAHPSLQRLEASWRQLQQLVLEASSLHQVKIRVINISWSEMSRDLDNAGDFDGSHLFKLVYSSEFGTPGGEPYGLLLGDYYMTASRQDLNIIRFLAQIASAAFAPFVIGVTADFFELDTFSQLQAPINLTRTLLQERFKKWKLLQTEMDMRFMGIVLPRVLVKRDHEREVSDCHPLWGNPCYAFATVAMNTFAASGWFSGIQNSTVPVNNSSVLKHLPHAGFTVYDASPLKKISTEVYITEKYEKDLNDLGFMALSPCRYTDYYTFYRTPSAFLSPKRPLNGRNSDSRLSSLLNYVMCVSRFAHYIKVITRDKMGSYKTVEVCELELNQWILDYTANSSDMSSELMAKHPLRAALITIKEKKQSHGSYYMVIRLQPHYQFEFIHGAIELLTDL